MTVTGDGPTIEEVLSVHYAGPRVRLVVASVVDHTDPNQTDSMSRQLALLGERGAVSAGDILGGIGDMLTTTLFQSNRFLLLERESLDALYQEQWFSSDVHRAQWESPATLEGADLLLLTAVTAFDLGNSGGFALPIPIKLSDDDFGILDLRMRTAYVAMDLRVVDVKTGRVVSTASVQGSARKFGAAMSKFYTVHGEFRLPGMLAVFENTPIQGAITKMIAAATEHLIKQIPQEYFTVEPE